jgi:hypothetical protein
MHNEVTRHEAQRKARMFTLETLTWKTVLSVASRFSGGAKCRKGTVEVIGGQTTSYLEGKSNACYWVKVEGKDGQWVLHFPKHGLLSSDLTLTKIFEAKLRPSSSLNARQGFQCPD